MDNQQLRLKSIGFNPKYTISTSGTVFQAKNKKKGETQIAIQLSKVQRLVERRRLQCSRNGQPGKEDIV
jgi:hypothetical protein